MRLCREIVFNQSGPWVNQHRAVCGVKSAGHIVVENREIDLCAYHLRDKQLDGFRAFWLTVEPKTTKEKNK